MVALIGFEADSDEKQTICVIQRSVADKADRSSFNLTPRDDRHSSLYTNWSVLDRTLSRIQRGKECIISLSIHPSTWNLIKEGILSIVTVSISVGAVPWIHTSKEPREFLGDYHRYKIIMQNRDLRLLSVVKSVSRLSCNIRELIKRIIIIILNCHMCRRSLGSSCGGGDNYCRKELSIRSIWDLTGRSLVR